MCGQRQLEDELSALENAHALAAESLKSSVGEMEKMKREHEGVCACVCMR